MYLHQRKPNRKNGFDYCNEWSYYVTIVTELRICYFGKIDEHTMFLSGIWNMVHNCWFEIPNIYSNIELDEFIIMPNHIHGIITMGRSNISLSSIIKCFKQACSKIIHKNYPEFAWQKSFHDHIIRNSVEYEKIKYYIQSNPQNWDKDKFMF